MKITTKRGICWFSIKVETNNAEITEDFNDGNKDTVKLFNEMSEVLMEVGESAFETKDRVEILKKLMEEMRISAEDLSEE